jgi:hypothetical protein
MQVHGQETDSVPAVATDRTQTSISDPYAGRQAMSIKPPSNSLSRGCGCWRSCWLRLHVFQQI